MTHPGVQKWLKNVFVELKSYIFDYFKLDYLIVGIRDGIRYENNISRVEAYRIGMQIIRDAVGKDSFILACGAPPAPSLGFVDAMRVSMTLLIVGHPTPWKTSLHAGKACLAQSWHCSVIVAATFCMVYGG